MERGASDLRPHALHFAELNRRDCHAGAADGGKRVIITPLMQYLTEKHTQKPSAAKAAAAKVGPGRGANAQRKGAAAARLRSTSLAPVAEAEESDTSAAAAPAAAADAKAVRKVLPQLALVWRHPRPIGL